MEWRAGGDRHQGTREELHASISAPSRKPRKHTTLVFCATSLGTSRGDPTRCASEPDASIGPEHASLGKRPTRTKKRPSIEKWFATAYSTY
jgi:hypothetical protein